MSSSKSLAPSQFHWEPHPTIPGGRITYLLAPRADDANLTCALVELPVGTDPEPHLHDHVDDLLYVLSGQGVVWVEDLGDVPLLPDSFLRIPCGVRHRPHAIAEPLRIYNTWSPSRG